MSSKTLTLDSQSLFLTSLSSSQSPTPPPLSFSLLSNHSPLPPIPTNIPQSKLIPKTRFIIDGFKFSGDYSISYFLSHFHADHYTGITSNWSKGIIFCSNSTARLLVEVLGVSTLFVFPLAVSESVLIDGCEVSLIDANHCPGAVQFLFKVPVSGKFARYVHTGDFRYRNDMKFEPVLSEFVGADAVFLDTTYCNKKFVFPSQEESIDYIVEVIERIGVENEGLLKSVLFVVATYVIGKERILIEISRRCNRKIHVDGRKMAILRVLGLGEEGVFTEEEGESDVYVVGWNVLGETWPYFRPNFVKMKEIMNERGYSKIVGFVPTGWTYEVQHSKFSVRKKDSLEIHLVPYSEHSNYDELREYVKFLKPKRVIPTVGVDVDKLDSKHANAMQKHFAGLIDEMAIKQEFLMGFHRGDQEKEGVSPEQETKTNIEISFPEKESGSRDLVTLDDNEIEETLEDLRDCLPTWVTRNQMLGLLSSSGRNVVDAVSNFYEHETEFHDQAIANTSSACSSLTSSFNETALLSDSRSVRSPTRKDTPPLESKDIPFPENKDNLPPKSKNILAPKSKDTLISQSCKSTIKVRSTKSSASPGKRRINIENKPKKKAKTTPSQGSVGPKQCTITRFFNKLQPTVSEDNEVRTVLERCNNDKQLLPRDTIKPYIKEVDQFIQIINGNESLRSHAATILEETKGDINMALDMYYGNCTVNLSESKERSIESCKSVQDRCSSGNCSVDKETGVSNEIGNMADIFVPTKPMDDAPLNPVSLAPENYSPIEHACWKHGQPAPYIHLAQSFSLLEDEKGKIKATLMLCNMFRSLLALSPGDVLPAVYLCTNKIAPDHENMELNIGGSIVVAALEEACGTSRSRIRDLYNSLGDLGDVAQLCRQTQSLLVPPPPLTIQGIFSVLRKISVQTGSGSTIRKKSLIVNLMRSCREKEMKFLVRTLVRNLRIGAMMRTVLPALAQAVVMNSSLHEGKSENMKDQLQGLSAAVVEAYNILPNLDLLIPSVMEKGLQFSSMTLSMVPGIPIKPMLAKITNGIPQVLKLFQNKAFTCEYKYDGQRAQIHKLADGSVHVFSRNGDETTSRFPDLVKIIEELCSPAAVTFILDAEVVAVDRKNGCKLMSFQELSSRERGSKDSLISVDSIKVDICIYAFDIMFANGEQLLGFPLRQRRKYLKDLFGDEKLGYFEYAKETAVEADSACETSEETLTKMNSFLEDALHSSCEGIMVKSLDVEAGYTPSKRSDTWLKVKRDYVEGLNDSLDLVPIGAWHGNGRKAGWYSPFLMACYDPDNEEFQSVCRVMSGFSDVFYKEMKEFYTGDKILRKKPPYYQTAEVPDMWFSPELVWEIRGADFTVSPVHHAAMGLVHPSRGISVRFPRFVHSLLDRKPEECSTATDIAEMFRSQTRKMDSFAQLILR
ncbi:hypothetical protein LguiB_033220 [Lonicera macranthoides]